MFFCTDVQYDDEAGTAVAAALGFRHSSDPHPARQYKRTFRDIQPYIPGEFYRRELPCLLGILEDCAESDPIDAVFVDAHVWLRPNEPGLGHHLWRELGERIPVIGVAKARFRDGEAAEVLRGRSKKPLFVTAVGTDIEGAERFVRDMHGPHRIPTLLNLVDALCRGR